MGTNYYLYNTKTKREGKHVGKVSSMGRDGIKFTWAIDFEWILGVNAYLPFIMIINEYGEEMLLSEFKQMIDGCTTQDHSFIGKEFS